MLLLLCIVLLWGVASWSCYVSHIGWVLLSSLTQEQWMYLRVYSTMCFWLQDIKMECGQGPEVTTYDVCTHYTRIVKHKGWRERQPTNTFSKHRRVILYKQSCIHYHTSQTLSPKTVCPSNWQYCRLTVLDVHTQRSNNVFCRNVLTFQETAWSVSC